MTAPRKAARARKVPQDRKPKQRRGTDATRLDIACGQRKEEGWTGIDVAGDADIVHDLFDFPWPIADGTVKEARCAHFVEHIPHWRPGWDRDGFWLFFDEVYRVLAPDATIDIWHPYSRNDRAFWDPTHERFIHDQTWYYLDAGWRAVQGLDHYPVAADFEVVVIDSGFTDGLANRNDDFKAFAQAHYFNAIGDLHVQLRRR